MNKVYKYSSIFAKMKCGREMSKQQTRGVKIDKEKALEYKKYRGAL